MLKILLILALIPFALFGVWLLKNFGIIVYRKFGGRTIGVALAILLVVFGVLLYFPGA